MWCTEWFHSPNAIFRGLEHGSRARSYWCVKSLMFDPSLLCFCCFVLCRFKNGPRRLLERRAAARHGRSGLLLRSLEDVLQKVLSWEQMNSMVDVLYWFSCVFLWYSASMTCFQPINQFDMFRYIECRWHRHFFAETDSLIALGVGSQPTVSHQGFATTWVQWKMPPMRSRPQVCGQSSGEGTRQGSFMLLMVAQRSLGLNKTLGGGNFNKHPRRKEKWEFWMFLTKMFCYFLPLKSGDGIILFDSYFSGLRTNQLEILWVNLAR